MTDETPEAPEATAAEAAAPSEPVPFWHRPHVERYLSPLVIPIVVVIGLVIYVLNISRVFLSAHGHTAVIVGSILTVTILVAATVMTNSKQLRSQSIALMTGGFILIVIASGWLVLGHSQVKGGGSAPLAEAGPCDGSFTITALPTLKFAPSSLSVKTGVYCVTYKDAATSHTLEFDDSSTLWAGLAVDSPGQTKMSRIYFGKAGDYSYFCSIPGHRAAGMAGVVHVTGNPITLADAQATGKAPAAS